MKALTLTQPWATLIARGVKWIETRSWGTSYRGRLAIHAAKGLPREKHLTLGDYEAERDSSGMLLRGPIAWPYRLPLGAVVATAELVDVVRIVSWAPLSGPPAWAIRSRNEDPNLILVRDSTTAAEHATAMERVGLPPLPPPDDQGSEDVTDQLPFGDFTPGRWAWLLDDIRRLKTPAPAAGSLGLWELELAPELNRGAARA